MIGFHRLLIAAAVLFCLVLAVWMFAAWRRGAGGVMLALSIVFATLAVALSYYLKNLDRFLRR